MGRGGSGTDRIPLRPLADAPWWSRWSALWLDSVVPDEIPLDAVHARFVVCTDPAEHTRSFDDPADALRYALSFCRLTDRALRRFVDLGAATGPITGRAFPSMTLSCDLRTGPGITAGPDRPLYDALLLDRNQPAAIRLVAGLGRKFVWQGRPTPSRFLAAREAKSGGLHLFHFERAGEIEDYFSITLTTLSAAGKVVDLAGRDGPVEVEYAMTLRLELAEGLVTVSEG